MTVEWENEWVDVGYVKGRDSMRQTYKVCLEAEDEDEYVKWTDEFIQMSEDFNIITNDDGEERVYKRNSIPQCSKCGNKNLFYDEDKQEHYCPRCE